MKLFTYPTNRPGKSITQLMSEPILIGLATGDTWQLESFPLLLSPRVTELSNLAVFLPTTKTIVKRVVSDGEFTVGEASYDTTTTDDPNCELRLTSHLDHTMFLNPSLRLLGVYVNITYKPGVSPDNSYYRPDEVTGDLFYVQSFKPIERLPNLTQDVEVVLRPHKDISDWYADDIHWVGNIDYIYVYQ